MTFDEYAIENDLDVGDHVWHVAQAAWNAALASRKSFSEAHPANPDAKCKCEHWQSCAECHPTAHTVDPHWPKIKMDVSEAAPSQEPVAWPEGWDSDDVAAWLKDRSYLFDPYIQGPLMNRLACFIEDTPLYTHPSDAAQIAEWKAAYEVKLEENGENIRKIAKLEANLDDLRDEVNYHRTDAKKASQQAYRLRIAMEKAMSRLASLLDEDQFAEIENIVEAAGVIPMDTIEKIGPGETEYDPVKAFMAIPPIEGGL